MLRNQVLSKVLNFRQTQLLRMLSYEAYNKESIAVDIGCNIGYLAGPLSQRYQTVGLDIDREMLADTKRIYKETDRYPGLEFICCDICHLPLQPGIADIVVCASVLEHLEDLQGALTAIKTVLKPHSKAYIGYPIETAFLEAIIKVLWHSQSHVWRLRDPDKSNPHVHKSGFREIRNKIRENFQVLKTRRIPFPLFPVYENLVIGNEKTR